MSDYLYTERAGQADSAMREALRILSRPGRTPPPPITCPKYAAELEAYRRARRAWEDEA